MVGPKLTLVDGTGAARVFVGAIEVVASPIERPPFVVDVVVEEEDRHLVLSAPPVVPERAPHPIRVMTALWEDEPRALGSLVVRRGAPTKLLAVVHDLDRDRSVEVDDVRAALAKIPAEAEALGATAIALPLLGAVHGVLDRRTAAALVGEALRAATTVHLRRVWLVTATPTETLEAL